MEKAIYVLSGAIVVLIAYVWLLSRRLGKTRRVVRKLRADLKEVEKKMAGEISAMNGQLNGIRTAELDVPALEEQIEESSQQLFSSFREKVYEISKRIDSLEQRLDDEEE